MKKIKVLTPLEQEILGHAVAWAIPWKIVEPYIKELECLRRENKKLKEQRSDHIVSHICERIL